MSLQFAHEPLQLLHVAIHIPVNSYELSNRVNQFSQTGAAGALRNQVSRLLVQRQVPQRYSEVPQRNADLGLVLRVGLRVGCQ